MPAMPARRESAGFVAPRGVVELPGSVREPTARQHVGRRYGGRRLRRPGLDQVSDPSAVALRGGEAVEKSHRAGVLTLRVSPADGRAIRLAGEILSHDLADHDEIRAGQLDHRLSGAAILR